MSSKIRVCVVDDDAESIEPLAEDLRLHHYEVVTAYSGKDALEVCSRGSIDLVLLDVAMPEIDGYEVCRRLKSDPATADIVVVFVTVKGSHEDITQGYALGAADYITKPYNLPMVIVRAEAALNNRGIKAEDRLADSALADNGYTDHLTGLRNRRYLMERLQEESEKAHRYDVPMSCVVLDLDDVRAVDEENGPVSVDDLLAEVAMSLRHYTRAHDVLARYDGTLFAAVLPHTPLENALRYINNILNEIDSSTYSDPNFPTKASMSVGVVSCRNGSARSAEYILGEAMRNLFQAKRCSTEERVVARNLPS
ncbi:MAG: diguanylate cyclase [Candidatus Hydrogenedentota bacterium]